MALRSRMHSQSLLMHKPPSLVWPDRFFSLNVKFPSESRLQASIVYSTERVSTLELILDQVERTAGEALKIRGA